MIFKNITILDENFDVRENMYVGIDGKTIAYIGSEMPKEDYGRAIDGKGKLLMPAFYNAHAHSSMTLMRGYGENMVLSDWLNKRIFPFEDHLTSDAVYYGTLLSMAESARFGIASSTDMYFFIPDMARAYMDAKMKGNISRSISHFDDSDVRKGYRYAEMCKWIKEFNGAGDGKIVIDASLHSEYTNTYDSMKAVAEAAKELGVRMHVHLAETESEELACEKKYGKTTAEVFEEVGVFDVPTLAAHCIWIKDGDFDILKRHGVFVASNPISNLKLASGVCNVAKFFEKGIPVTIGTDSVASNNSLNFFEEMKIFAIASKMEYRDPTAVSPKETLYAATRAGALSQGRNDCGLLKEGFRADLILVDIDQPNMYPVYDLLNNLVYSASGTDVLMTMVDGEVIYENGEYKTIDIEKTKAGLKVAIDDILSKL